MPLIATLLINSTFFSQSNVAIGSGTTILSVLTPDTIVMAADTKYTLHYPDGKIKEYKVQKIHKVGNIYYAFSGTSIVINTDNNTETFNFYKTLHNILVLNPTFNKITKLLDSSIRQELAIAFKNPNNKGLELLLNKPFLGFIAVTFINKKAIYEAGTYSLTGQNKKSYTVNYDSKTQKIPYFDRTGSCNYINSYLSNHFSYLVDTPLIKLDNKLINLIWVQSKKDSTVASPIDIFKITHKGLLSKRRDTSKGKRERIPLKQLL